MPESLITTAHLPPPQFCLMPPKELSVYLTRGLQGRDDQIDLLADLFEQSQTVTVETANPMLDLISFAQDCTEFWVINAEGANTTPVIDLQDGWPQEEFTNSLGFYPSHPPSYVEPTSPDPQNLDHVPTEPFGVDVTVGQQQQLSSDYIPVAPPTTTSGIDATLQCRGLKSPAQPLPSTSYTRNDFRYSSDRSLAGFVYLLPSSAYPDALHFQEYNIGIILLPEWRNRGVAARALHLAIDLVFSQPNVHRIQAQLIDCYKNVQALTLFIRMGFSHEGTRRQSFHCPLTAEWKDVTTLTLLVTDWYINIRDRHGYQSAPHSLWDALLARHQQEREELLRWEDRLSYRSLSLETIRDAAATPVPRSPRGLGNQSDSEDGATTSESGSIAVERPKRKLFEIGIIGDGRHKHASDAYDASSSEYESENDSAAEGSSPKRIRSRAGGPSSATTSALPIAIDGLDIDLDSLPARKPSLISQMNAGPPADTGASKNLLTSTSGEGVAIPLHNMSRSPSLSPEPNVGSVATTPPSELDSEFELEDGGYVTSSSTASSSPTGWEFVNNDDDLRQNLQ